MFLPPLPCCDGGLGNHLAGGVGRSAIGHSVDILKIALANLLGNASSRFSGMAWSNCGWVTGWSPVALVLFAMVQSCLDLPVVVKFYWGSAGFSKRSPSLAAVGRDIIGNCLGLGGASLTKEGSIMQPQYQPFELAPEFLFTMPEAVHCGWLNQAPHVPRARTQTPRQSETTQPVVPLEWVPFFGA
jgi:hypothetical protein